MIWRWGRRLKLLRPTSYRVVKFQSLASIYDISTPIQFPTGKNQNSFSTSTVIREHSRGSKTTLTPQIVEITLRDCPSDLVALKFFLWCGRQPNYFHDQNAFKHMVSVVARLTERFKTVKRIVEELENVGCVTKAQTFMLLLRIYWRGEMYNFVFETFEQMIHYGYTPNTFARNIVMDVFFKIEQVEAALKVLKQTQVPNFLSFSIAICNLCKIKDLVNIKDVLTIMLSKGYYLNPETYSVVLSCYCKSGRPDEALQLLGLMITLGIRLSVTIWSMIIDVFRRAGRLDVARSLLGKMFASGYSPNIITCTSLIKGFMESQMLDEAFALLGTMESIGYHPDLVFCNVLIDCFAKSGRYGDAFDIFYSLQKQRLTPDAYTFSSILSAICLSKQFALLPILLDGFMVESDLVACNNIISYFCKAGCPVFAVEFYEDMIDRGYTPDKYTFTELLNSLCKSGRIDDAVNVYNGIVRSRFVLDAHIHTVIINGLIMSGNSTKAIALVNRGAAAEKFPSDIVSYAVVIDGLFKSGRAGEAYDLFTKMKVDGIAPNLHIYNVMVSGFCKLKDVKMLKQILQEMVDVGIEMDLITIRSLKKLWYLSCNSYSVFNLFIELWDSGVLPEDFAALRSRFVNGDALCGDASSDVPFDAAALVG